MPGLKTNEVKLVSENGLQQKSITIDNNGIPLFNGIQIPTVSSPTINSPTISSPTFTGVANFASGGLNVGSGQLVVDSSGRVLMPNQPIISGQVGSTATFAAVQLIPFDDFWVQRGITYNSTTRRFTVPVAGIYRITMNPFQNATPGGIRVVIGINSDAPGSGTGHRGHCYHSTAEHATMSLNSVVSLAANDYICFQLAAGTLYNATGDRFNQFSIQLIG